MSWAPYRDPRDGTAIPAWMCNVCHKELLLPDAEELGRRLAVITCSRICRFHGCRSLVLNLRDSTFSYQCLKDEGEDLPEFEHRCGVARPEFDMIPGGVGAQQGPGFSRSRSRPPPLRRFRAPVVDLTVD